MTSPVQYAYNAGVGGKGVVPGRPADDFGIGWSGISLSDNFVPFLRQHLGLGLRREETLDLYYNALLTPWLGVALDFQITDPALKKTLTASNQLVDVSTIVVPGLRVYARF